MSGDNEFEGTIFLGSKGLADLIQAPDAVGHYLVVDREGESRTRVEVGSEPITIGRGAGQRLVLADVGVSRLHARVSLIDGQVVVEDLGSTNGTYLDAQRLTKPTTLKEGNVLRMGSHFLQYERRSRRDVERTISVELELQKATRYVLSLLPAPLTKGPVRAEWLFVPSTQLGGDAFGYYWLDPGRFVFYLIDVSGHGAGSAMHSVTVLNVLRQRALPQVNFENPAEVLASLNAMFQMESHGGLFFTMWYGIYRTSDRTLTYGSAGHHAAYLVPADKGAFHPLGMPATMIGVLPDLEYEVAQTTVPAGASLYLFSDGMFEIVTADQKRWSLDDFEPLLLEPASPGIPETRRLYERVKGAAGPGPLDDDASVIVVEFQ